MFKTLQVCRAVAALLVVLFHLGGSFAQDKYFGAGGFDRLFGWGDAGVDFFFVLSGFLIATVHGKDVGHPERLARYAYKRAVRIYPTYWLIALAVCASAWAVPALRGALPSDPKVLAEAFALIPQDPAIAGATGSAILFVAWSLQYEMLFYLVFGCFILHRGLGLMAVAGLMAVHLACRLGSTCAYPFSFVANDMIYLFAMGVGAAWLVRGPYRLPHPAWLAAAAAAAFVGFGAIVVTAGHDALPFDRRLVFGALAALVIVGLARAEAAGSLVVSSRWPLLLGDSSYALYLLHVPVISIVIKLFVRLGAPGPVGLTLAFAAIVLACIGTAVLFYLLIERRLLAALRSDGPRTQPAGLPGLSRHEVAR